MRTQELAQQHKSHSITAVPEKARARSGPYRYLLKVPSLWRRVTNKTIVRAYHNSAQKTTLTVIKASTMKSKKSTVDTRVCAKALAISWRSPEKTKPLTPWARGDAFLANKDTLASAPAGTVNELSVGICTRIIRIYNGHIQTGGPPSPSLCGAPTTPRPRAYRHLFGLQSPADHVTHTRNKLLRHS